jgi:predicted nucleic acid-binding protein
MESHSFQIPTFLNNTTVLVDTNFFIDAFNQPEKFKSLIDSLKADGVDFVSISLVKYEFIRAKTIDVVKRKEAFFNELVSTILPIDKETEKLVIGVIEEYKQYMEGLPVTDLVLAALLKKYRKLYLLTRDHKDFPTVIFDRCHIFTVGTLRDVWSYGIYAYK